MTDKPSSDETYKAAQVLQKLLQEHDAAVSKTPNSTLQCEKDKANSTLLTPVNAPKQVPQHVLQIPAQALGQNTRIIYVRPSPQPGTSGQILLECSDVTKSIGIVGGGNLTPEAIAKIVAANATKFGNQGVTKYVLTNTSSSIGAASAKAKETDKLPGTVMTYRTPGATNVNKSGNIKRPMNAFMVWARDYRAKLAASMPNATNSDISIRLGQLWSQMSSEEKKPYYQEADNIKRQHRRDYPDWVYKPSPTRKKEEAPPTQHSVLWARYTQGKGLTTAGETIPNPVQVSASGNIISGAESMIPWTSVSNSTMRNQVAYPTCSVKSSSDQEVDSTLSKTSERQQIPSANSLQVETYNAVVQRQLVCPYTEAVSSNTAIPQQNISSNTVLPKQVVDSSTVKQTTISIPNDTTNSCTVAQQTSFLSVKSDISTTSVTPVDSSSREDAGKERNEPNLATLHKFVGNNYGKDSESSVTDLNSVSRESFKSISTHVTSSWTSHVYTPERNCIPSKTGTHHITGSGSTSLSAFQSEESFISSNSCNVGLLKSVHTSDSSTQLIKSSSTEKSAASIDSTSHDSSSARSRSLVSSYKCSSTSSNDTFQQSSSSFNFTPIVSSSSNYSWDSSTSNVMDDSCGSSISEKSQQSSSKIILSRETSSNLTPSSSFAKSVQSTTTASSRQELSSSLLRTPSKADRTMSSFTLSKTDQSSNVSNRGQESSSSSTNSGVSFIQMNTHADPKQKFSTFGQYSSIGASKQFQQVITQEPVIDFDESGQHTHLDLSSSSGSLKMGKEYSLNITGQTKIKQNDIKTVTKVIPIRNTTRTIPDAQTENSSLRRLLTATTLPSDLTLPESPPCNYVTVVDRSLVCNKQPVHQIQPTNSKEGMPTNVSQSQATERKHPTSSKMSRRKINKYDNTGNSRILVKEMSVGKSSDGIGQMTSSHSSSLGLDTQSDKDDKFKSLYHGFLDPYDPFFYEGETLYSEYFPDALEVDVTKWNQYLDGEGKEPHVKVDNLDTCFKSDPGLDSCHCSSDIDLVPLPLSTTLISGQKTPDIRTSSDSNSSRSLNTGESLSQEAVFSPTPSSGTEKENENDSIEAVYNEAHCPSNSVSARNAFLRDHTYTEVVSDISEPNICRPKSISQDSFSSFASLTNSNDESLGGHSTSCTISTPSSEAGIQESSLKIKDAISDGSWNFSKNINVSATPNLATTLENAERPFVSKICSVDDGSALAELSDDPQCPSHYDINIANDFEMSTDTEGISLATLSSNEQNPPYSETENNARGTRTASKYSIEQNNSFPDTIIAPEYFDHLAAAVSSALKAVEDPFVGANTVEEELMKLDCTAPLLMVAQNICRQTDQDSRQQIVELNVKEEKHMESQEPCCSNVSDASELESIKFENVQPLELMDGNKTLRVWKSADGKILCQMLVSPETMSKECWRIAPHVRSNKEEKCMAKNTSFKIPVCSLGLPIAELENSCRLKAYAHTTLKDEVEKKEEVADSEVFTVKCVVSEPFSHTSSEPTNKNSITPTDPSVTKFQSWGSSACGNGQMLSECSTVSSLSTSEDGLRLFRPLPLESSDLCTDLTNTNDVTASPLDMGTSESALSRNCSEDGNSNSLFMNREFHINEDKTPSNVQCTPQTERIRSIKEEETHAKVGGELDTEVNKHMARVHVDHELDSYGSQDNLNTNCNDQQFLNIKHSDETLKDMKKLLEDNQFNALIVQEENASIHNDDKSSASCSLEKKDRVSSPYKRRRSSASVQVIKATRRRFV